MKLLVLLAILTKSAFAPPAHAELAAEPQLVDHFHRLLRDAKYGFAREQAAFVVRLESGAYVLVMWPDSGTIDGGRWEGRVPEGTVAIVHTHPNWLPMPSNIDRATSRSCRLPVYVLTGNESALVVRGTW